MTDPYLSKYCCYFGHTGEEEQVCEQTVTVFDDLEFLMDFLSNEEYNVGFRNEFKQLIDKMCDDHMYSLEFCYRLVITIIGIRDPVDLRSRNIFYDYCALRNNFASVDHPNNTKFLKIVPCGLIFKPIDDYDFTEENTQYIFYSVFNHIQAMDL